VLLGGKAAPGYRMAKLVIKLVANVAAVVDADPEVGERLKLAFYPNYRVTAMELICPATDLSEQISLAGKEASGTGNMKLMMNGALTIGTMDGANIEILEAVGEEHFFRFGLDADEVERLRPEHDPRAVIEADPDLARAVELLASGAFSRDEPGVFEPILRQLTAEGDPWMVTADFRSYVEAQERAARAYRDPEAWSRSSVLNAAASGRFSSDRTVAEYNREIWKLEPVLPELG
jgi:starch phosphorylase